MKYCSQCGGPIQQRVPSGDLLPRAVCTVCEAIHYENPKIVVGCVPEYEGRILLCRRAIEPRRGYWTVPAGFLENGETLEAGAARESWEEAQARVEIGSLVAVVSVVHARQVHIFFRARLPRPEFGVGAESLETELVRAEDVPWPELAFPSTEYALRRYFEDRAQGRESVHLTQFERPAWRRSASG
jgi:ADP-ribose pyrophosphatase YjhB (NUDIX family)